ncbi:MAG: hypothetical protein ABSG95_08260 [Solirubrobacteraceae bacterium]|jgi:hypothetical protein
MAAKRSYGCGSIYVRTNAAGVEAFYGSWSANGRHMNRRLGVKRSPGGREGLTLRQAEQRLRLLIGDVKPSTMVGDRLTVEEAARLYVVVAKRKGRKPSTCANIESEVRVHLAPFFAGKTIDGIEKKDVLDLMSSLEA